MLCAWISCADGCQQKGQLAIDNSQLQPSWFVGQKLAPEIQTQRYIPKHKLSGDMRHSATQYADGTSWQKQHEAEPKLHLMQN